VRLLIAKRASDFVAEGMNVQEAADAAIRVRETKVGGSGGLIIVDRQGKIGFATIPKICPGHICARISMNQLPEHKQFIAVPTSRMHLPWSELAGGS